MSAWSVVADLDLCQGHQMCRLEAPDVFGWDKATDTVIVRLPRPPQDRRADVERAVRHCPAMALSISESVKED
jgi:ferredoxin